VFSHLLAELAQDFFDADLPGREPQAQTDKISRVDE
jgi:hypothetical protein